jgi:hypothetical protein
MTLEDILYEAWQKGIKDDVFEEVNRLRGIDGYKHYETKRIYEEALNNVLKTLEEKSNENIQRRNLR